MCVVCGTVFHVKQRVCFDTCVRILHSSLCLAVKNALSMQQA
jgi:predicted nucleic acid-binding Zn ribbon protein